MWNVKRLFKGEVS